MKAKGNIWGTGDGERIGARRPAGPPRAMARGIAARRAALGELLRRARARPRQPVRARRAGQLPAERPLAEHPGGRAGRATGWAGSAPGPSDFLLMLMGPPVGLLLPVVFLIGLRLARGVEPGRWGRALILSFLGIALIGAAAGLFAGGAVNGLPAGWGGAIGLGIASLIELALGALGDAGIDRAVPDRDPRHRRRDRPRPLPRQPRPHRRGAALARHPPLPPRAMAIWTMMTTSRVRRPARRAVSRRAEPRSPVIADRQPRARPRAAPCASASPRSRSATATPCPRSTCSTRRRRRSTSCSTRRRSSAMRACWRACSTISR